MCVDKKRLGLEFPLWEAGEDCGICRRGLARLSKRRLEGNRSQSIRSRKYSLFAIHARVRQLILMFVVFLGSFTALGWAKNGFLTQDASQTSQKTIKQRYMVLYKPGVTDKDRARVRGKLRAVVLNRFSSPLLEELVVQISNTNKGKAELANRLDCVKKDPAVQSIQPSYSYSIM
jgi:hypothetical protein